MTREHRRRGRRGSGSHWGRICILWVAGLGAIGSGCAGGRVLHVSEGYNAAALYNGEIGLAGVVMLERAAGDASGYPTSAVESGLRAARESLPLVGQADVAARIGAVELERQLFQFRDAALAESWNPLNLNAFDASLSHVLFVGVESNTEEHGETERWEDITEYREDENGRTVCVVVGHRCWTIWYSQRRISAIVALYDVKTGAPVWVARDAATARNSTETGVYPDMPTNVDALGRFGRQFASQLHRQPRARKAAYRAKF